jgi:CcmD family protein
MLAATLPVATLPALPLHTAGKYVAGAYIVVFALVLVYVAIMALRVGRIEREVKGLLEEQEHAHERAAGAGHKS